MHTFFLIIGAIAVIAGAGGVWLWSRGEQTVRFNAPVQSDISTETVIDETVLDMETDSAADIQPKVSEQLSRTETQVSPSVQTSAPSFKNHLLNFGFAVPAKTRSIDTIILHSSYNALGGDPYDVEKIIQEYKDYGVAAHYLVARDGTVYRLVTEANIAYHAGESTMPDGRKDINNFSIGIEMVGTKTSGYTDKQYDALQALSQDIKSRHAIKFVLGHGDIAPDRKTDPWQFDWKRVRKEP